MWIHQIMGIAIALAMDAFAVAVATGLSLRRVNFRQYFRFSWHFGLFQGLMPIIGWMAGLAARKWMESVAHWVAFALLSFVAIGMIREAFTGEEKEEKKDPTRGLKMVSLSIAVSIDALAVGFSLSLLKVSIWIPALIIGGVASLFTLIGLYIGKRISGARRLSGYAEIVGAIVLVSIGVHILVERRALPFW